MKKNGFYRGLESQLYVSINKIIVIKNVSRENIYT